MGAAPPAAGLSGAYTLVAGTPPAGDGTAIAEADSGFPQSMQKRDPGSFRRPQMAQVNTTGGASAAFGVG